MPREGSERISHVLKPARSTTTYREILFVDTETEIHELAGGGQLHILRVGVACYLRRRESGRVDKQEWHTFRSQAAFWELVDRYARDHGRLVLVAHNWSYDLPVLHFDEWLSIKGWEIRKMHDRKPLFILRARRGEQSLLVLDNFNFFPGPLDDLGVSVGLPKIPVDFKSAGIRQLEARAHRDVEIMVRAWIRWQDRCEADDLGPAPTTISQHAMNAYRHRFMPTKIYIHTREAATAIERAAYAGGRCDCLELGVVKRSPIYLLDVNSFYPSVMAHHAYPVKLAWSGQRVSPAGLGRIIEDHSAVATVTLETDRPWYPVRAREGLVFPVGRFDTALATPELDLALRYGHLAAVESAAVYEQADLFTDYVDHFYSVKTEAEKAGDALMRQHAKLMLNTLYGKFGQRTGFWEVCGPCTPGEIGAWEEYHGDDPTPTKYRKVAGTVQRLVPGGESFDAFPAIAAHATSYGRVRLLELIEAAGWDHVYYFDTDGLFVDGTALKRLRPFMAPGTLGGLEIRAKGRRLTIWAPKHYELDGERTVKGIRRNAEDLGGGVYRQMRWPGISGMIRQGSVRDYRITPEVRRLTVGYRKGVVLETGRTRPWILPGEASSAPAPLPLPR